LRLVYFVAHVYFVPCVPAHSWAHYRQTRWGMTRIGDIQGSCRAWSGQLLLLLLDRPFLNLDLAQRQLYSHRQHYQHVATVSDSCSCSARPRHGCLSRKQQFRRSTHHHPIKDQAGPFPAQIKALTQESDKEDAALYFADWILYASLVQCTYYQQASFGSFAYKRTKGELTSGRDEDH
jgi:hypothetical protein